MLGNTLKYALPGICDGHVVGLRGWRLVYHYPSETYLPLHSVSTSKPWMPGKAMEAFTPLNEGDVWEDDGPSEHLGVHAYKLHQDPPSYYWADSGSILGLVALWGEIVEHKKGYRAQYGYPICFFPPPIFFTHSHNSLHSRRVKRLLASYKPILNGDNYEQYWIADSTLYTGAPRGPYTSAASAAYLAETLFAKARRDATESLRRPFEEACQRTCLEFSDMPDPRWITNRSAWSSNAYE